MDTSARGRPGGEIGQVSQVRQVDGADVTGVFRARFAPLFGRKIAR